MHLWDGSLQEFARDAIAHALAGKMVGAFYSLHGYTPSEPETRSWSNSLEALAKALDGRLPDDVWVVCEYHLPMSGERLDVVLLGSDKGGAANAVVVENKQWSDVDVEPGSTLVLVAGAEHQHPSRQADNYAGWLTDTHSSFVSEKLTARSCAFLHNLADSDATPLRGSEFEGLLADAPLFVAEEDNALGKFLLEYLGAGGGKKAFAMFAAGKFKASKKLLEVVESTIKGEARFHLIGTQQTAYDAILAQARKAKKGTGKSAILVRGGPGTGKSVIAIQLLADAMRLGLTTVHTTGGKAFTTALRSKFGRADKMFAWNLNIARESTSSIDLLLVDEAHRVREDSNTRFTKTSERSQRTQVEDLLNAGKVTVFFLDENQFVRPDEVGNSELIRHFTEQLGIPLKEFDLDLQFRCGGCVEYTQWLDYLLGFGVESPKPWGKAYNFRLLSSPAELDSLVAAAVSNGERSRIVAGFCWRWSDPTDSGELIDDVKVGAWSRPWNAKRLQGKAYKPQNDPYTLWADTAAGEKQIGCIYSAQGFEFDRVGVIWGRDLVWRSGEWVAQPTESFDKPVKTRGADTLRLVRNAYRVLLSRGIRETAVLCLDSETREHIAEALGGLES